MVELAVRVGHLQSELSRSQVWSVCLKAGRAELEKFTGRLLKVICVNEINQRLCEVRRTREPCLGPKKCQHLKRRVRNRLKRKQRLEQRGRRPRKLVLWKPRERTISKRLTVWEMFFGFREMEISWWTGDRSFHSGRSRNQTNVGWM